MLKFYLKIALLFTLIASTIFGIIYFRGDIETNYFASIADKHRFAKTIHKPKIILAGGSNLAFGIASDSIEKALNIPVVNLGLYAGFGLDFVLKETLSEVQNGDIVILSPEYYLKKLGDDYSKEMAAFAYAPAHEYVDYQNYAKRIEKETTFLVRYARNMIFFPNRIKSPQINDTISDYYRKGFSEKGDLLAHLNNPPIRPLGDLVSIQNDDYSTEIQLINQFVEAVQAKKAQVYWYFPSFSQTGFETNKKALGIFEQLIKKEVNCPKINRLADDIYPDNCFYDTHFHLYKDCRIERTQKLIKSLKNTIH